jgi:hypothetical protein
MAQTLLARSNLEDIYRDLGFVVYVTGVVADVVIEVWHDSMTAGPRSLWHVLLSPAAL